MKPFEHGRWHVWDGTKGVLMSDESMKRLFEFDDSDACINWLWLNGYIRSRACFERAHQNGELTLASVCNLCSLRRAFFVSGE
jgi:hypothetical protein